MTSLELSPRRFDGSLLTCRLRPGRPCGQTPTGGCKLIWSSRAWSAGIRSSGSDYPRPPSRLSQPQIGLSHRAAPSNADIRSSCFVAVPATGSPLVLRLAAYPEQQSGKPDGHRLGWLLVPGSSRLGACFGRPKQALSPPSFDRPMAAAGDPIGSVLAMPLSQRRPPAVTPGARHRTYSLTLTSRRLRRSIGWLNRW